MVSEWSWQRLEELVDFLPKRPIKKGASAPFIAMADVPENQKDIIHSGDREYKGGGSRFSNGDTLFARITPCLENGKTALVKDLEDEAVAHGSTEFIVMSPRDLDSDRQFVYYLARLPEFRKFAESRMEGTSGRQRVSWQALANYELNCPPAPLRKRIGEILGTLDDKIELNRKMNETLEAMAQALFKSWFVDFDPVIDNALAAGNEIPEPLQKRATARQALGDQRKPLPADIQSLFPDHFVFTDEMGWIPDGWEITPISNLCDKVSNGGTPRRTVNEYWENGAVPWLTSGEVRQTLIDQTENFITDLGLSKSSAKLFPVGTTVVAMYGATAGQVAYLSRETSTNQAICGLVPLAEYSLYNYFSMERLVERLLNQARGSAQQNISKGIIEETQVVNPSTKLVTVFQTFATASMDKWVANIRQIKTLEQLRDTILPKLLSGELRITDTERQVAEAL
ncbi:restriction endonuclease subunit S [Methylophaga sp.]|uniref:restriction endonuclease subunit S n=1 Tax=Methylophaga sp. TaxID=2024840 RepID=UPI003A8E6CAE